MAGITHFATEFSANKHDANKWICCGDLFLGFINQLRCKAQVCQATLWWSHMQAHRGHLWLSVCPFSKSCPTRTALLPFSFSPSQTQRHTQNPPGAWQTPAQLGRGNKQTASKHTALLSRNAIATFFFPANNPFSLFLKVLFLLAKSPLNTHKTCPWRLRDKACI